MERYWKGFSNPNNPDTVLPPTITPNSSLVNFPFTCEDLVKAIDEVHASSSSPDFSVPAIVLKKCKYSLAKPLYLLWKESLNTGTVPAAYKSQLVTPVFKKGSRSKASNYRPISLTPHKIKVFERIICDKVIEYLERNSILSSKQHGFRKGRSCLTQLLQQYDRILLNLLEYQETDSIYLDYAKAFDKVDHQILIQKLKNIGIGGNLCKWVENFLHDRKQVVVVDGVLSSIANVLSGVPQGTVLGPLLFLIFSNDMENFVGSSSIGLFADDTRLSKAISQSSDSCYLQKDLESITKWSIENNMKLHEDKFVYMNFNTRSKKFPLANLPFFPENFSYITAEGLVLEPSESVLDLGVILTEDLKWSSHVHSIIKTAKRKAGWSLSIFKDRSPLVMKTLYKSIIRSHLEYACPLWLGLSKEDTQAIEAIQRSFTNKINCPANVQNYWDIDLFSLNLCPYKGVGNVTQSYTCGKF